MKTFHDFGFETSLDEGLDAMGFKEPTPVQVQAIPPILDGKDMIACAQTGTGKTAAYLLPVLNDLAKHGGHSDKVDTLIIAPTRELAIQIEQQVEALGYFTNSTGLAIYGGGDGLDYAAEKKALEQGADIIVCTPGRLMSHLNFDYADLSQVRHFILDEADRMLDMGFYTDIMKIASHLPKERQTLLFSATMPPNIRKLANEILVEPANVNIAISKPAAGIMQAAYLVNDDEKIALIKELLIGKDLDYILVFASTKMIVKDLTRALNKEGLAAQQIHSDLDQKEREEILLNFRNKKTKILVATDILARGIDIDGISLVLNYDVPKDAEDYVHRVGRTARAAKTGVAITLINGEQMRDFRKIEALIETEVRKMPLPEGFSAVSESSGRHDGGKARHGGGGHHKGKGGNKRKNFGKKGGRGRK
jgi:superfamily II DNA/RNA helicase